jgi:hypothetical protein
LECGRCSFAETGRPLEEVRIKEHKCNLTQGLLENSKSAQHAYKEGYRTHWKEAKVLQIEPNTTYHMFLVAHPIVNPAWKSLYLNSHQWSGSLKITTPPSLDHIGKFHFYAGTIQMPPLSNGFIFCTATCSI